MKKHCMIEKLGFTQKKIPIATAKGIKLEYDDG